MNKGKRQTKNSMSTSRRSFFTKTAFAAAAAAVSPFASFGKGYETAIDNAPKNSNPSDLKITDVKCAFIRRGGMVLKSLRSGSLVW